MNLETIISLLTLLGVGSVIGAYVNHLLEKKREMELHFRERKEEQYKKFLEYLIGFFDGWEGPKRKKEFMRELYTHAPLYASSEVIKLSNEFLACFRDKKDLSHGGNSDQLYRKLVLEIRKDMGIWKKGELTEEDIDIQKPNN